MLVIGVCIGANVFVHSPSFPQTAPIELQTPEQIVEQHFIKSLNSDMTDFWKAPTYNASLSAVAMGHAKNGTNSFKINASTPEEAGKAFDLFESQHYTYWESTHWLMSNQRDHPNASYGIAVYKNGTHYNVCVMYNLPQSVTSVIIDGYTEVSQPADVIQYLWDDSTYRPDRYDEEHYVHVGLVYP